MIGLGITGRSTLWRSTIGTATSPSPSMLSFEPSAWRSSGLRCGRRMRMLGANAGPPVSPRVPGLAVDPWPPAAGGGPGRVLVERHTYLKRGHRCRCCRLGSDGLCHPHSSNYLCYVSTKAESAIYPVDLGPSPCQPRSLHGRSAGGALRGRQTRARFAGSAGRPRSADMGERLGRRGAPVATLRGHDS